MVTLNGAGSSNPNGNGGPLTFMWRFISRPPGTMTRLFYSDSVTAMFLADAPGTYVIQLIVSNATSSTTSNVTITSAISTLSVLSGRVVDVGGNPFPGISVYACPHNPAGSCGYALTGADGSYQISVPNNAYTLSYGRSSDGTKPDGFYTNSGFTTDPTKATLIQLAGNDIANLNVQMPFAR